METRESLRERFWAKPPPLPHDLRLVRGAPLVIPQSGPGGAIVLDTVTLTAPAGNAHFMVAYKAPLLPRDVAKLRDRLAPVLRDRQLRSISTGAVQPAIVTEVATPSVMKACIEEGVALFDQRGTVIVRSGPFFIHVEGKGAVERHSTTRLFAGKPQRIVRYLLNMAGNDHVVVPRTAQQIAAETGTSYVYCHGVLIKLERENFLRRRTPHSGFFLRDPVGLLRAWMKSGETTAAVAEGFYAPSTTKAAFIDAVGKLSVTGQAPLFTYASGLDDDEVHVSGLPHGAYLSGDWTTFISALGLRKVTPHNFILMTASPLAETAQGGIYMNTRDTQIRRVSLPQLIVDFANLPGRGAEQAEFLIERFAKSIPYSTDIP